MTRLQNITDDLLDDKNFNADWTANLPYVFDRNGRNELLGSLLSNLRVIHVGFADHGPLIASKRKNGIWLHDRVMALAKETIGVDINTEAVSLAKSLGVNGLHALDIKSEAMVKLTNEFNPDLWLLPDVLEHLQDPIGFLQRLRVLAPQAQLLISIPNGLSLRNITNTVRGIEKINTDHLCWYSPYTGLKTLRRGGYAASSLWSAQIAPPSSLIGKITSQLINRIPILADNLVILSKPII